MEIFTDLTQYRLDDLLQYCGIDLRNLCTLASLKDLHIRFVTSSHLLCGNFYHIDKGTNFFQRKAHHQLFYNDNRFEIYAPSSIPSKTRSRRRG